MRRIMTLAVLMVVFAASANAAENWRHDLGIYGWMASLEGTIGVGDNIQEPVSATFDDLKGYLDFALAGHYEARGPKTVYLVDISYVGLGSERDATVLNQPAKVKMDLDQWIIELGGGIRVAPKFDVLLVGRYYIIDTGATFSVEDEGNSRSIGVEWFDIFLGARYHSTIGSKWFWSVRGDIGFGGSDFAWFGQATLGYTISDHFSAVAAWRLLGLDYEGNEGSSYFKYDVTQSGLGIALGYHF